MNRTITMSRAVPVTTATFVQAAIPIDCRQHDMPESDRVKTPSAARDLGEMVLARYFMKVQDQGREAAPIIPTLLSPRRSL